MDTIFLAIALFSGLDHLHFMQYNNFDANNLYYIDQNGAKQPIVFKGEFFVPYTIDINKIFTYEKVAFTPHKFREGFILQSSEKIISVLLSNKVKFYPIFNINNNSVIYKQNSDDNTVLLMKVKPFVTNDILWKHLNQDLKLEVLSLRVTGDFTLEAVVKKGLYNRLLLANMLAEDKIWFDWVQPSFELLNNNINCEVYLENDAVTSIGHTRYLTLDISYYNSNISIPDDMIPLLGRDFFPQTVFVPQNTNPNQQTPPPDEAFYDVGKPIIKRSILPDRNVVKVTYPFKYFTRNKFPFIKDIKVRYLLNGTESVYLATTYNYYINNLVIEPETTSLVAPNVPKDKLEVLVPKSDTSNSYLDSLDLKDISNKSFIIAGTIIGLYLGFLLVNFLSNKIHAMFYNKLFIAWAALEKDFLNTINSIDRDKDNWRNHYVNLNIKFTNFFKNEFGFDPAEKLSEEKKKGPLQFINAIFEELNKVYQKDAIYNLDGLMQNVDNFKTEFKVTPRW